MAELLSFEVIGPCPVVDAVTGEDVEPGGTVRLDPDKTIIHALVGVHVKPLVKKPEKKG